MSFFSTTEILKSLVTDEFLREIMNSDAIKSFEFNINDYLTDEVVDTIFSNTKIRNGIRKIIIEILSDMNIRDEVDNNKNEC